MGTEPPSIWSWSCYFLLTDWPISEVPSPIVLDLRYCGGIWQGSEVTGPDWLGSQVHCTRPGSTGKHKKVTYNSNESIPWPLYYTYLCHHSFLWKCVFFSSLNDPAFIKKKLNIWEWFIYFHSPIEQLSIWFESFSVFENTVSGAVADVLIL